MRWVNTSTHDGNAIAEAAVTAKTTKSTATLTTTGNNNFKVLQKVDAAAKNAH